MFLSYISKKIKTNFFFIILTITIFTTYGKSINFDYTNLDDDLLIPRSIFVSSEIKNIPKLFLTSCYYSNDTVFYRPILSLSFVIEATFFKNNIKIYHLTNIILFILSIYLMYVFLYKLRLDKDVLKFIILLIAVHPIFTSCAVWIPGRNDTLLTIFIMLSFINFVNYLELNKSKYVILYFFFFILALFTKETAIAIIPMYFIFIFSFGYRIKPRNIINNLLILFLTLIIYFILRSLSVSSIGIKEYILNFSICGFNILPGFMTYIEEFIIPKYIPVMLYNIRINPLTIVINILTFSFLAISYYRNFIDRKIIIFSLLWFIICLLPTFFMQEYLFLTHRLIIPSLGMIIIITLIINKIIIKYPISKKYLLVFFIILFTIYSYASYIQQNKYQNPDIFWVNAYLDAPNYHSTLHGLANIYISKEDYEKAKTLLYRAENIKKTKYLLAIANVLCFEKKFNEAEILLFKSIDANVNKPLCYKTLSAIYMEQNNIEKALEYAQKAYRLDPNNIVFSELLSDLYIMNKNYEQAVIVNFELIKLDNKNSKYYYNLSILFENLEDNKKAIEYIQKAIKINNNFNYKKQLQKLITI